MSEDLQKLTATEATTLHDLEQVIEKGLARSVEVGEALARPAYRPALWEAAGPYRATCKMVALMCDADIVSPRERQAAARVLDTLTRAHVVTCAQEQVDALPQLEDLENYAHHLRPPFPVTFLSLGKDSVLFRESESGETWTAIPFPRPDSDGVYRSSDPQMPHGALPCLHCFIGGPAAPSDPVELTPDLVSQQEQTDGIKRTVVKEVERALAVLALLDNTVGVELREKDRREVSRQVMRQAERAGARIAWTVAIEVPKRSSRANGKGESKANYSHRFERAANFACFTRGPHVADPAKLSSWCPRHGAKACRREFRPATIVGPAHLPLIPKVRRITEARA